MGKNYTTETRVPEKVINFFSEELHCNPERALETVKGLSSGRLMSGDEMENYIQMDKYSHIINEINSANDIEYACIVDADNDGLEDIFWVFRYGNSGIYWWCLLQGQSDGCYLYTDFQSDWTGRPYWISYDGKNYLVENKWNYYTPSFYGFTVSCYEDGRMAERVDITMSSSSYQPEIVVMQDAYKAEAEEWAQENIVLPYEMIEGTAEHMTDEGYDNKEYFYGDINNDGIEDHYYKYLWINTTISSSRQCYLTVDSEDINALCSEVYLSESQMIWLDQAENGKNILYYRLYDGEECSYIYGYLIEGNKAELVLEIVYHGNIEINVEHSTDQRRTAGLG